MGVTHNTGHPNWNQPTAEGQCDGEPPGQSQPSSGSMIPPDENKSPNNPTPMCLNLTVWDCAQEPLDHKSESDHKGPPSVHGIKHFILTGQSKFTTTCKLLTLLSTQSDALCTHLLKSQTTCTYVLQKQN